MYFHGVALLSTPPRVIPYIPLSVEPCGVGSGMMSPMLPV